MKIPKIIFNDGLLDYFSWFMKIGGITLWPWIILREKYRDNSYQEKLKITINHESIHIKQQAELLVIPFYILYLLEWFIKLFIYGTKSYKNISFEREGYYNAKNLEYLKNRKFWAWIKYI
jgi:beta-lactamase regulating signal transducer with metallopeptidase domain